ncbi:FAD:protein FMN transferase [Sphingomonadaceae bacterium G21617-S1]|nr:FAD:protein FMN transferase [Sphingomonadaceae bacterium G21617-S1]
MGTGWSIRIAMPAGCDLAALEAAILARLDGIVDEMSHWRPDSLISVYNRGEAGSWQALPPDFDRVMQAAIGIAHRSGGAFDPTVGHLVDLAGFGPDPARQDDDARRIDDARRAAGWERLRYREGRLLQPGGIALDLSGIAKGHAVDAVADLLRERGIAHALVEIGGELAGRGMRPDGDPWWVDLEDPPGLALPPFRIALHGLAVATSGDYRRGAHTIDPRSGRSAITGVRSVSVIHQSAMLADAWATALTVLGSEEGLALATREHLAARIVADREIISPALAELLEY